MQEVKAADFPEVYTALGIDTGKLGCIMLDTEQLVIDDIIKDEDYYYSDKHTYVNGNVSEDVPHITLLYGLLRSGPELQPHVDMVMGGWKMPPVKVKEVSFFYGEDSEFVTIVALIEVTPELTEAHQRLSLLPHINTFGEYKPHLTLAYVKSSSDWQQYVKDLNFKFGGAEIEVVGLNYGH